MGDPLISYEALTEQSTAGLAVDAGSDESREGEEASGGAVSSYEQVRRVIGRAVEISDAPCSGLHENLGRKIEVTRTRAVGFLLGSESARELLLEWLDLAQAGQRAVEASYCHGDEEANFSGGDALLDILPGGTDRERKEALGAMAASLLAILENGGTPAQRQAIAARIPISWDGFLRLARAADGELTHEADDQVQAAFREQISLFNRFVMANLRLVKAKAGLQRAKRDSYEDVFQEAVLGLTRAVQLWDYRKGFQFSTFAEAWIRQAANKELYTVGRVVATRYDSVPLFSKTETARNALAQQLGRAPTDSELAHKLDMPLEELRGLINECSLNQSLDAPIAGGENLTYVDAMADPHDFAAELEKPDTARTVREACHALTPVERQMVSMKFGLDGEDAVTVEVMAERFGMRRETARLALKRGLDKLRTGALGAMLAMELDGPTRD
jgi:RNA polymerase nonessential primary-like sigma factor